MGEILIDVQLISSEQLAEALNKQRNMRGESDHTRPLGLLPIEMGHINTRSYFTDLSKHFNMPIQTMIDFEPSSHLQSIIGSHYARERRIIVLEDSPETIKFVLAVPSMQIIEELQKAVSFGKRIEFYLANHTIIDECFLKMAEQIPPDLELGCSLRMPNKRQ